MMYFFLIFLVREKNSVELHLLVLLKFLGSNGNEATISKLGMFFQISKGSFRNTLKRAVSVLLKHLRDAVFWPEADERKEISLRIKSQYKFPNCVGIIDGTLFPLELKPKKNGEDYFCRKSCYAVHALITCDDTARIRDIVIGWPGSVHDNRVWTTSLLYNNRDTNFGTKEYLLGDSAFQESDNMVPAFKKPRGAAFLRSREFFNTQLAKPRVRSEHTIGILKGRFQYLKRIRVLISKKRDMIKIVDYVNCASILHNWLIHDPIPSSWIDEEDEEDDYVNNHNENNTDGSDSRRNHLLGYILEKFNFY